MDEATRRVIEEARADLSRMEDRAAQLADYIAERRRGLDALLDSEPNGVTR